MLSAGLTGYLKIPDIQGEVTSPGHEGEIDIHGIEWKVATPAGSVDSGRTQTRAEVGPFKVRKRIDASSPYLALSAMQSRNLAEVVVMAERSTGDSRLEYLKITLTNVKVVSYSLVDAEDGGRPSEEVSFQFESINYLYVEEGDDQSAGDEHEIEYDVVAGA